LSHAGPLRDVVACHCRQYRRTSGRFVATTEGSAAERSLADDAGLRWFEPPPGVLLDFCGSYGSSVFPTRSGSGRISTMAGTLDGRTGLQLTRHIHVADRGDYHHVDPDPPSPENADQGPAASGDGNRQQEEA